MDNFSVWMYDVITICVEQRTNDMNQCSEGNYDKLCNVAIVKPTRPAERGGRTDAWVCTISDCLGGDHENIPMNLTGVG